MLFAGIIYSQTGKSVGQQYNPTNMERLYVDYEIKNNSSPDSALITHLDINQYDHFRQQSIDVEVTDTSNNIIIILYSIDKASLRKSLKPQYYTETEWNEFYF